VILSSSGSPDKSTLGTSFVPQYVDIALFLAYPGANVAAKHTAAAATAAAAVYRRNSTKCLRSDVPWLVRRMLTQREFT
jgi:hypothetical protein